MYQMPQAPRPSRVWLRRATSPIATTVANMAWLFLIAAPLIMVLLDTLHDDVPQVPALGWGSVVLILLILRLTYQTVKGFEPES